MRESTTKKLTVGMVGLGMIFEETYRPVFEQLRTSGLYQPSFGIIEVALEAVASRTGTRADHHRQANDGALGPFQSFAGADAVEQLLKQDVDVVCIATPDDRHFPVARAAL